MKTLVLGLGNPILSDDGVGFRIARGLKGRLADGEVTVAEASLAGFDLLDLLIGYDRAIIIDAIQTDEGKPGSVYRLSLDEFEAASHAPFCHGVNLTTAIRLGRQLGLNLPSRIDIFAVEATDVSTFGEDLSPEVERAVPVCLGMIARELGLNSFHFDISLPFPCRLLPDINPGSSQNLGNGWS